MCNPKMWLPSEPEPNGDGPLVLAAFPDWDVLGLQVAGKPGAEKRLGDGF